MRVHESPSTPIRVLTADPDDAARSLYRETLVPNGCEVIEAIDGRDALVKALVRVPALVITELRLPLLDGFALCDIMRRDRTTANVPIVIATAETRADELTRARQIADAVLPKSNRSEALLQTCARLLAKSQILGSRLTALAGDITESVSTSATILTISTELRQRRTPAVKAHLRFTTTSPPGVPPALTCPSCDRSLTYELSYIGGVSDRNGEQWDYYVCTSCGTFQYRQRTRRLRRLRADEEHWLERLRGTR